IVEPVYELGAFKRAKFHASPLVDNRTNTLHESWRRYSWFVHDPSPCDEYHNTERRPRNTCPGASSLLAAPVASTASWPAAARPTTTAASTRPTAARPALGLGPRLVD